LPLLAHALELMVHAARGTPRLAVSLAALVAFTALSTSFNLFAMRRGALIVLAGRQSVAADLRSMPRLIGEFLRILGSRRGRTRTRGACDIAPFHKRVARDLRQN
jgi:hypothetical protein